MSQVGKHVRRMSTAVAVAAMAAGSVGTARADDGIGGFFQQIFGGGGGGGGSTQPLPQPDYAQPSSPPLTVRMRKHRRPTGAQVSSHAGTRYSPEAIKGITIYTDKTLVSGDAVMTPAGIRIFSGSSANWPHTKDDFVALSSANKTPKTVRKELTAIDVAARTDFRRD